MKKRLEYAKKLLKDGVFEESLKTISEYINEGNHSNEAYIVKAKALDGLGRIGEARHFFDIKINWINPSNDDLEMIKLLAKIARFHNWDLASDRIEYIYAVMTNKTYVKSQIDPISKLNFDQKNFDGADMLYDIACSYFTQNDIVKSAFYLSAYRYFSQNAPNLDQLECGAFLSLFPNTADIYTYLAKEDENTFAFVVEREEDTDEYIKMGRVLSLMKKNVVIFCPPIKVDIGENEYDSDYFLELSCKKSATIHNIECLTPIIVSRNGVDVENSTFSLLNKVSMRYDDHLPVFAERDTLDNMNSKYVSRKDIHYVCNGFDIKNSNGCTCFAYIKGYEKYASKLYNINVISEIKKDSKYTFSIVLPVRNNIDTFIYTLRTCIDQSFSDYEIVISDNSDDGDDFVYNVVNELKCSKIRYYRTPRKLTISKSFEFAYLKARGEFLIPIGADDAVLHNGLSAINQTLRSYPDEDILLWDRLHYVWPNFIYRNQSCQFIIPKSYKPNDFNVKRISSYTMLKDILDFRHSIYGIPLLYINSGMKRSYLLKMLNKTGAMIDGISQDVYTGIVNLCLNNEFCYLQYPVTIAGLSSNSAGGTSLAGSTDSEMQERRVNEFLNTNIAQPVDRNLESNIPLSDGDISIVLKSILRLIDMECLNCETINDISWKRAFKGMAEQLQKDDIHLESKLLRLLNSTRSISSELYEWFHEQIRSRKLSFLVNDPTAKKSYYKGFSPTGSLSMDASDFDISNIYEAAHFASKLLNL